jgi:hypothetical protein
MSHGLGGIRCPLTSADGHGPGYLVDGHPADAYTVSVAASWAA